jgi:hypothetical protein
MWIGFDRPTAPRDPASCTEIGHPGLLDEQGSQVLGSIEEAWVE